MTYSLNISSSAIAREEKENVEHTLPTCCLFAAAPPPPPAAAAAAAADRRHPLPARRLSRLGWERKAGLLVPKAPMDAGPYDTAMIRRRECCRERNAKREKKKKKKAKRNGNKGFWCREIDTDKRWTWTWILVIKGVAHYTSIDMKHV